jgi:predicted nuclease of predicted toxin-antitoxin system
MKLLLDQGLPRSTVIHLERAAIKATHVGDRGLATASDSEILDVARREGLIIVTLDADFHMLLAMSGANGPSVIRIRIEGLRAEALATLLVDVLKICGDELTNGAVVSVTQNSKVRVRNLPISRGIY